MLEGEFIVGAGRIRGLVSGVHNTSMITAAAEVSHQVCVLSAHDPTRPLPARRWPYPDRARIGVIRFAWLVRGPYPYHPSSFGKVEPVPSIFRSIPGDVDAQVIR